MTPCDNTEDRFQQIKNYQILKKNYEGKIKLRDSYIFKLLKHLRPLSVKKFWELLKKNKLSHCNSCKSSRGVEVQTEREKSRENSNPINSDLR